jgi:hypothetical protein
MKHNPRVLSVRRKVQHVHRDCWLFDGYGPLETSLNASPRGSSAPATPAPARYLTSTPTAVNNDSAEFNATDSESNILKNPRASPTNVAFPGTVTSQASLYTTPLSVRPGYLKN